MHIPENHGLLSPSKRPPSSSTLDLSSPLRHSTSNASMTATQSSNSKFPAKTITPDTQPFISDVSPKNFLDLPLLSSPEDSYSTFCSVFSSLVSNSIPTIIYMVCVLCVNNISLHFIGLLNGPFMLDGVGLANTLLTCTAQGFIISLNNGLISMTSQSYGAKNYLLAGLYFHKALLINTLVLLVVFGLLSFSKDIFSLLSMPAEISTQAQAMITYIYGGLYVFMLYDTLKSHLIAQDIFYPQVVVQVLLTIGHWFLCQLFVIDMGLSVEGIALAFTVTYGIGVLLLYSYVVIFRPRQYSWIWFRRESFRGLWSLLITEAQIGSMVYLEWIANEILVLFSLSYPPEIMGAQITFYNFIGVVYFVPLGLSMALNALSGIAIGEKNTLKANRLICSGIIIGTIEGVCAELLLYLFMDDIARFYTMNPVIREALDGICTIYMFAIPADFSQVVLGGYIRGVGKEKVGMYTFFAGFYGIGLPVAFLLGNVLDFEVMGLWMGLTVGLYSILIANVVIMLKIDLKLQVKEVERRITLYGSMSEALTVVE